MAFHTAHPDLDLVYLSCEGKDPIEIPLDQLNTAAVETAFSVSEHACADHPKF